MAVVLISLELVVRLRLLDARWFPPVSEVFTTLVDEAGTSRFWGAFGNTLQSWSLGLVLAFVIAVPAGLAIGSSRRLYTAVKLVIEFLRPVPSVALIPLAVVTWGIGTETKVFLITFACVWPLLFQAMYGVQDVDPVALDTARSFRANAIDRWRHVILPGAMVYVATGVRVAVAIALMLSVAAEVIIGAPGLGREMGIAQSAGVPDLMYAYIVATGLVGMVLNFGVDRLERRLLRWHTVHRERPE